MAYAFQDGLLTHLNLFDWQFEKIFLLLANYHQYQTDLTIESTHLYLKYISPVQN